jgi:DNA-directed RNA polymerase subunit RPC12/RpoP
MKINCKNCGSRIKIVDVKKLGAFGLVLAIPMFIVTWFIAPGTFVPFLTFLVLSILGIYFIFKKDRFVYWCSNCSSKTDKFGKML